MHRGEKRDENTRWGGRDIVMEIEMLERERRRRERESRKGRERERERDKYIWR